MKRLPLRKKLLATAVAGGIGLGFFALGEPMAGTIIISVAIASFNLGQGIADAGKEKASVERDF